MMLKKILITLMLFCYLATSVFAPAVKAQGSWYNPSFEDWSGKVFDSPENEIFGERYTYAQVTWILYSLAALISGMGTEDLSCLISSDPESCIGSIVSEAEDNKNIEIANSSPIIGSLERVPVSGIFYVKKIANKFSLVPEAKAQEDSGFGFDALNPILKMWQATRNITYAFFVIFIVITAFMIMFRVKINPQTVISIQSALPKIIIALILVTFSYAIAGFLIDFLYLVIGLIATILIQADVFTSTTDWKALFEILTNGPLNTGAFGLLLSYALLMPVVLVLSLGQALLSSFSGFLIGGLGTILLPIILIVLGIVLIIAVLKLLWLLFQTFAIIILLIITAPFQIALGAILPNAGFGHWLRSLASNLVVYPVVGVMLILAIVFAHGSIFAVLNDLGVGQYFSAFVHKYSQIDVNHELLSGNLWSPPLTTGTKMYALLWFGVSFVLVVMTPQVANIIRSITQGKPFAFGTAIGEAFGPISSAAPYYGADTAKRLRAGAPPRPYGRIKPIRELFAKIPKEKRTSIADFIDNLSDRRRV